MEYSELEKKVIKKGHANFTKELQEASKSMLQVLRKYKISHSHPLLEEITLNYPYSNESYFQYAVRIPTFDKLESLNPVILELFMGEIERVKEIVDDLDI